eukprot:2176541-Amphidinium_carterae.1
MAVIVEWVALTVVFVRQLLACGVVLEVAGFSYVILVQHVQREHTLSNAQGLNRSEYDTPVRELRKVRIDKKCP